MGSNRKYFKPLRKITIQSNKKKDQTKKLIDKKKYKTEIEKLYREIKDLEQAEADWLKQDTPKFLASLRDKFAHDLN